VILFDIIKGDTLWLLGIDRGENSDRHYKENGPSDLTTKPSILGDLFALPSDSADWNMYYGKWSGWISRYG
jgi:hypothetical protein